MTLPLKIDKTLRERRRINRLLDFLKRDDLTGEQVGAINAFALVVIGIIANQNVTGSLLGRGDG